MKINTQSYQKLLKERFGKSVHTGQYRGSRVPIIHECRACGEQYRASPERVLSGVTCLWCTRESAAVAASAVEVNASTEFISKLACKFEHLSVSGFTAVNRVANFTCWCGAAWEDKPRSVLSSKHNPCPECSAQPEFTDIGRSNVLMRTGRTWTASDRKFAHLQCWCGTKLTIPVKLCGSPAVECPTCMGLRSGGRTVQVVYKHRGLDRVSYHEDGLVILSDLEIGWQEARSQARQVARVTTARIKYRGTHLPADAHLWTCGKAAQWLAQTKLKKIIVLGIDPGVTNCAWSVIQADRHGTQEILATGMIQNTVKEFTVANLSDSARKFEEEIRQIVEEFSATHLIAERFMSRGMKGLTIELVNAMLGILLNSWRGAPGTLKLITAAQWKNEWNRNGDLTAFYSECDCEVHQVDSIGIGLYGVAHWFNRKPFESIKMLEPKIVQQIKERNLG